jgi:tetratricopeptide (TPR) repeat protein
MADAEERKKRAVELFQRAYQLQMRGELEEAMRAYQRSIELFPTAEAHTFLGWTYSHQRRFDEAISECRKAIAVDPEFGNPYNDIGAYLIEQGKLDEAIPWLEKATRARRYENPCFPRFNLGRVWEKKGLWTRALEEYEAALRLNPRHPGAQRAALRLRASFN